MPTVITHAVAGATVASAFPLRAVPRQLVLLGAVCAMAPDFDVVGFRIGIHYGDLLGHRGLTHSMAFAACLSFCVWIWAGPLISSCARNVISLLYLFVAIASHGVLDAFTDGGLGIAFFSPFDPTRYFFPFRPVEVSPIGARFFSARGLAVLQSEFVWVWIPCVAFVVLSVFLRRAFSPNQLEARHR